ncbi:MAG: hypothetical protein RLZZ301_1147 [Bacteroidota bacterium]
MIACVSLLLLSACMKGIKVDLVVHNAQIHVLDEANTIGQAMAISDGKVVEVGPERQILNKYRSDNELDARGKDIYPGLTDAHGHLLMYAKQLLGVDLTGARSLNEVIYRCEKFQSAHPCSFIVGRGWDQTYWAGSALPSNELLNKAFPDIPVCLYRIDGHAALVNEALIEKSQLRKKMSGLKGGLVVLDPVGQQPTGLLIDNAMNLVSSALPDYSKQAYLKTILQIQEELLQYGITGVHEAGIDFKHIAWFRQLVASGKLKLDVYAMLMDSPENRTFARKNGPYQFRNLSVRSFKCFADGALGSRGAFLKQPYSDDAHNQGLLLTDVSQMKDLARFCLRTNYQLNTHGIGDSANALILSIYAEAFKRKPDHRFRIEHAQVIDPQDAARFSAYAVFPSVQPTHAVSDARWAQQRLGATRMKGAYAYRTLLQQFGMLAIGTDFPVEKTNPFLSIEAALNAAPEKALTFDEVVKGMTIWAAFAAFQERHLGSLEKGKQATFAIFEQPLASRQMTNCAWRTFIKGRCVYKLESL